MDANDKAERLAKALRENLKRRKLATRELKDNPREPKAPPG